MVVPPSATWHPRFVNAAIILLLPWIVGTATALAPAACPLEARASAALREAVHAGPATEVPDGFDTCSPRGRSAARLAAARTLLVQFQQMNTASIDRADPDVLIIDSSWDGSGARQLNRWDVRRLRWRLGRPPRIVLAYVSVGEAEDYRYYWDRAANGGAASFLDRPNPNWPGNVRVRFWDPAWHAVLFSGRDAWVDRILAAGFDGVFLDTVDAAETWVDDGHADAPARMADLIAALARHARLQAPGFLVVASNPFVLMGRPGLLEVLSGILAEGHVLSGESLAPPRALAATLEPLRRAARAGVSVMLVEYPRSPTGLQRFASLCASEGFLCYAGREALDRVGVLVPREPRQEALR